MSSSRIPLRWLCPDRTPLRPGGEWRRSDALRRAQCRCRCSWCWSVGRCRGVGRRSPECGQQHAALEHEPLGEGCLGQPGEEALQDVKLDQLVDRAPVLAGLPAQVEIGLSGDSSAGRRCHSSTARAWRRAGSACGNHRASSVSRAWLAPDRLSQRRRACHARSLPSPVPQPDGIDDGAFRGVEAQRSPGANVEQFPLQVKGAGIKLVQAAGRPQRGAGAATRYRDINRGGDRVDKAVPGQRGLQAQRRPGNPFRDLHQVIVGRRGVRPAIDPAT